MIDLPVLEIPEDQRTIVLTESEHSILRAQANLHIIRSAEDLHTRLGIPRWAAVVSLQPSIASAVAGGASLLGRNVEARHLLRTAAELAGVNIKDSRATVAAALEMQRVFASYLAGERMQ